MMQTRRDSTVTDWEARSRDNSNHNTVLWWESRTMMAVAVKESHSRCTDSGPPRPWQTGFLIVQERLLREHLHLLRVFIGRSLTVFRWLISCQLEAFEV